MARTRRLLTQLSVDKAQPRSRRYEIPDGPGGVPGFALRVGETGVKSYVLRYRYGGRQPRLTLGLAALLKLADARARARKLIDMARAGRDPASDRRAARRDTVAAIAAQYLELHVRRNGQRRAADVERMFKSAILPAWGERAIQSITKRDALDLVDGIAARAPVMANRTLALAKRTFAWAVERGVLEASPLVGMKPPAKERSRDRVLSDVELAAIWRASAELGWPYGPITRLLILTASRRGEVCGLRWAELDLGRQLWVKPAARVKGGRQHTLSLSAAAVELLQSLPRVDGTDAVFPARAGGAVSSVPARAKACLDALAAVADWRIHDLRRTTASGLARLGVQPQVIAAILDHAPASVIGVTAIYQRHRHEVEVQAALERWAGHVQRLAAGAEAQVLPLRAG